MRDIKNPRSRSVMAHLDDPRELPARSRHGVGGAGGWLKRLRGHVWPLRVQNPRAWRMRSKLAVLIVIVMAGTAIFNFVERGNNAASALAQGDGLIVYGEAANTTPRMRTYTDSSNSFAAEAGTVAGAIPGAMMLRSSPTKKEMVAGYVDSGTGTLRVMCYDGTTWTNEWNVAVGGTATTRRFDIAYETSSGDVLVLYSGNVGTSNEMAYRTKAGSSACGSANWSGATNLSSGRTNGVIRWIKATWDRRSSSNLIAAAWADDQSDLSAAVWSGSAWGNEVPTSPLSSGIEEITTSATDVDSFDLEFESDSGDLLVVWGNEVALNANGLNSNSCTGGTSSCTWGTSAALPTTADTGASLDIAANPQTNEISLVALESEGGANSCDASAGYWSGSAWTGFANVDITTECPTAGTRLATTFWLINGNMTRYVFGFDDSTGTGVSWYVGKGSGNPELRTDFAASPAINDIRSWWQSETNPIDPSEGMLTLNDSLSDLYAKRLVMSNTGAFTWTNADGGSVALEASMAQATVGNFSWAYWRQAPTYDQAVYRWYNNNDGVQPGSALANENTSATIADGSSPVRLRMGLANSGVDVSAGAQGFQLEYATSTSGPWTMVADDDAWCSDASGITCNTSWLNRRKITFNNSASTENLAYFPVLVTLTSSNTDYSKIQDNGEDLRFVDPASPSTVLSHEIESWSEGGTSYIWVEVPQVDSGSKTDYIWLYYNNESIGDGQDVSGTWDGNATNNYKGVWHLKENPGTTCTGTKEVCDSTSNNMDADANNMDATNSVTGEINGAIAFNGSNEYVDMGHQSTLYSNTAYTVGCWVKATNATGGYLFSDLIQPSATFTSYTLYYETNVFKMAIQNNASFVNPIGTTTVALNTWYYVVGTWTNSTNQAAIYVNGVNESTPAGNAAAMPTFANTGNTVIGRAGSVNAAYFTGSIDECRFANTNRSAEWIEAEYLTTTGNFVTVYGEEAQNPAWKFKDNATPADGASISSSVLTGSTALESYEENNPTVLNPTSIATGGQGEWDFSLDPVNNLCQYTYYFRMVKADGTPLATYTVYPQILINIPKAPVDEVMRHGRWFSSSVEQPFSCDWMG